MNYFENSNKTNNSKKLKNFLTNRKQYDRIQRLLKISNDNELKK